MIYWCTHNMMFTLWIVLIFVHSVLGKSAYFDWQQLDALDDGGIEFTFCSSQLWYCKFIELFGRNESFVKTDEMYVEIV